jgi:hypothetical protein
VDNEPENVPETVEPDDGSALKLYVVTVCDGAVNVIVALVFVLADTDRFVGVLGTLSVVVITVVELDVPSELVADKDIVYSVFSAKPVIW